MNNHAYATVPTIKVVQPFGVFYIARLRASLLLEVTFADPFRVTEIDVSEKTYHPEGGQRGKDPKKVREISDYIETTEVAFPNSIILGANYNEDGTLEQDEKIRWRVEADGKDKECLRLIIPTSKKLASIIDGQHRVSGFQFASPSRTEMELLCAIYLDLPNPYQAYLFATINFNQKKVDRSLAYELFGISLEDEPAESWSPEKTAVFLTRRLNVDEASPLHRHIIIAAQDDDELFADKPDDLPWAVSTATVVDGLLRLFSAKPKKDRVRMYTQAISDGRARTMLEPDGTPLRGLYLKTNDLAIYTIVKNYFIAAKNVFWSKAQERSSIIRTVGIQALFDILLDLAKSVETTKDISSAYFTNQLRKAASINFSDSFFEASGKGRTRIKNTIAYSLDLIPIERLPENDLNDYRRLAKK